MLPPCKKLTSCCCLVTLFTLSNLVQAKDNALEPGKSNSPSVDTTYQLPDVLVIGKKNNKGMAGRSVFTQDNLDTLQANNIASVLDNMPGVGMAGSPRPGGQTINIWGMGNSEDVPISVDGALKTFDKYRQGSVFIEPELIKRVTVDKGAHDASVGNGGFGGSVRLDTKDASDFLKPDQNIGLFTKYSYHTNNHQNNYTAAFLAKSPNDMLVRYSPMSRPNYYKIKIELG